MGRTAKARTPSQHALRRRNKDDFSVTNSKASTKVFRVKPAAVFLLATASLLGVSAMQAQSSSSTTVAAPGTKAATGAGVNALAENAITKYDNKWEVYGGLNYANGQAGQNLPKHYNMGGGEVMGTYWLGRVFAIPSNHLGVIADYRIQAGTTPVLPQASRVFGFNRILAYQNIFSGGLQYRGPKNRYVAIDFHALAGATHGTFDSAITSYPITPTTPQFPSTQFAGVYSNSTTGYGAAGGSIDFNYSPKVAIRLQPDITFEHFGTETREFFAISAGLVYRIGKRN